MAFHPRTARQVRGLGRGFTQLVNDHPHAVLACKGAVAAAAAWLIVQPLGGVADDYPYYAPLGAVVVMSTTVMTSVRTALQALAAIVLGAVLAVTAMQLPVPQVIAITAVIGLGMGLAGWRRLGEMGVWVPFAALFVLLFGDRDNPWYYVLGYAGLTGLGAAVGVAVNLIAPQLPLGRTLQALTELQSELSHQLRALVEDLRSEEDLGHDGTRISSFVTPRADRLQYLLTQVREGRPINWRAGRWRHLADRREEQARAMETISYLVEEVAALLSRSGSRLRTRRSRMGEAIAQALEATADMLEETDLSGTADEPPPTEGAARKVRELREIALERPDLTNDEDADAVLVGASVTLTLQRAIAAWE